MGVMGCNRQGCRNVMCDRYAMGTGYICNDCFEELLISGIGTCLPEFMDSEPKRIQPDLKEVTYKYWDNIFSRNEDN